MAQNTRVPIGRQDLGLYDGKNPTFQRPSNTGGIDTLLAIGGDVDILTVYGGGVDRSEKTIQKAINAVGGSTVSFSFAPGAWNIENDISFPANIYLKPSVSALFNISVGKTMLVYSPAHFIASPNQQIHGNVLTGGTLTFLKSGMVPPNWWKENTIPGTTDMTAAVQAAADSVMSGGTVKFLAETYVVTTPAAATERNWQAQPHNGNYAHIAVLIDSASNFTFEGESMTASIIKVVSADKGATELSYAIGNLSTDTSTNITFKNFTVDVDVTGNIGVEQARGLRLFGITGLYFDHFKVTSLSGQGGYGISVMNSSIIRMVSSELRNLAGGFNVWYCDDGVFTGNTFYQLTEVFDSDVMNSNFTFTGNNFDNPTASGKLWDLASINGFTATGNTVNNFGATIFITSRLVSDTFANHKLNTTGSLLGGNIIWDAARNINISGANKFTNCANSTTLRFIQIGNGWGTDPNRVGVGLTGSPPYNIIFSNNEVDNSGQIYAFEAICLKIKNNEFSNITVRDVAEHRAAILLRSEVDWTTHPTAEAASDLVVDVSGNTFHTITGSAISVFGASIAKVDDNTIVDTDTNDDEVAAVHIFEMGIRGMQGSASNNTILAPNDGYVGLILHTDATLNGAKIKVKGNRINGHSAAEVVIQGPAHPDDGIQDVVEAEQSTVFLGTITAENMDKEITLLPAHTNMMIFRIMISTSADVTQNDTDYVVFSIRHKTQDGTAETLITSRNTKATGGMDINAFANVTLTGLITGDDKYVERILEGDSISVLLGKEEGAGQDLDDLSMSLRYIEY